MENLNKIELEFGIIYIEKLEQREEDNRIKVYDSNKKYLDYFVFENDTNFRDETYYQISIVERIKECKTINDLLDTIGISQYLTSKCWEILLKDLYSGKNLSFDDEIGWENEFGEIINRRDVVENDFVNIVGEYYILIGENG